MVQLITDKKRKVFTNYEWFLAKFAFFMVGVTIGAGFVYILMTHDVNQEKPEHRMKELRNEPAVDSTIGYQDEKHFDCTVEDIISGKPGTPPTYVTECGVPFYSKKHYSIGQKIKGFKSPKHG